MKWEYQVIILPEMKPQHITLNTLGSEGWELVAVVAFEGQRIAYLKRANDFMMTLEDFEANVLQVIRRNL